MTMEPGGGELHPQDHSIGPAFRQTLEQQGINFDIPLRLSDAYPKLFPVEKDPHTELAIMNNALRNYGVRELSNAIKNGENWAVILADADNLKTANDTDRELGDLVLRYGSASLTQAVQRANLRPEVEILAMRHSDAADEMIIMAFGLSEAELYRLKTEIRAAQEAHVTQNFPELPFSVSAEVITSDDNRIQEEQNSTKQWLEGDDTRMPYNFFQRDVLGTAEKAVKQVKVQKAIARLIEVTDQKLRRSPSMQEFIDTIVSGIGSTRAITGPVLELLLKITSGQSAIAILNSPDAREQFTELMDQTPPGEKKQAKSAEELVGFAEQLYGLKAS